MIEFRTHHSIKEIEPDVWNGLVGTDGEPYLRWEFLEALECTGAVRPDKGWAPSHISLSVAGEMVAVAPAYLKGNSEGEFVFDQSWAQFAYERLSSEYYPKLVVSCPFTPATGRRLLVKKGADAGELTRALVSGLTRLTNESNLSSAHILFPREAEADALGEAGLVVRHGLQYHWQNPGYASFDQFLERYSSKRRNQIKRERRELQRQGLELKEYVGAELSPEVIDHAFGFYLATVEKYSWGRQYLTREFFEEICGRLPSQVMIVLACAKGSRKPVAGALNYIGNQRLFGRYWGAHEDLRCLHFNVCYYHGIEYCIEHKLRVFEPGAGGEHKVARGFEPTRTFSAHILHHPILDNVVRDFVERESLAIKRQLAATPPLLKPLERPAGNVE